MFSISQVKIDKAQIEALVENDQAGAIVSFDGRVRNHNEGHSVKSLEYQAYESMAEKEGLVIMKEAQEKFNAHAIVASHRVGHLDIGDAAVVVAVSTSHRAEAFKACQYIIDEIKLRVPIWKKEHYTDKDPEWVACHRCANPHDHDHNQDHNHDHNHG